MSQKQLFERKLTQLITQQNSKWQSQGMYPVSVVILTWFEVSRWRWQTEVEGAAERRLGEQANQDSAWQAIAAEFAKNERVISVRRPSSTAGLVELYLLAYFGHWWVGLQTSLQEE
jgi:hypothetical protein